MTVEWTPEQSARWPPETHVLLDMFLARGAVEVLAEHDCVALLQLAGRKVHPYEMRTRDGSLFGVDGGRLIGLSESLRRWERWEKFGSCPLFDCEDVDFRQREVPVATPKTVRVVGRVTAVDRARGVITVSSERGVSEITGANGFASWLPAPNDSVEFYQLDPSAEVALHGYTIRLPRRPRPSRVPDVVTQNRPGLDGRRRRA